MTETLPRPSVAEERLYAAQHWRDVAGDDALAKLVTSVLNQSAFRGRNDDGNETTATWKANENTNWTQAVDVNFRVRFEGEETASGNSKVVTTNGVTDPNIRYNLNGAGYTAVTTTSAVVKLVSSSQFAGPVTCTDQMTTSAKVFASNADCALIEAGGLAGTTGLTPTNQSFQAELTLQIVGTDVADGDTIQLEWYMWGSLPADTYTNVPSITVSKSSAPGPGGLWDDSVDCAFAIVDF